MDHSVSVEDKLPSDSRLPWIRCTRLGPPLDISQVLVDRLADRDGHRLDDSQSRRVQGLSNRRESPLDRRAVGTRRRPRRDG